jgi:hypothetical protein
MDLFLHPALLVKDVPGNGRGVFAQTDLEEDTLLECSPVLVMNEGARSLLDQTLLHDYIFEWQPEGKTLCCVALGYLSLYNHSSRSNCEYFMDYDSQTMSIRTMRAINADEELSINYNGDWNNDSPVWFEAVVD